MPKQKPASKRTLLLRAAASIVLVIAAAYVLAVHWGTVEHALRLARGARLPWLAASLVCMAGTFCIAAGIYGLLALRDLRYRQTVVVELAAAFVNRLLPAGIGGLSLHGVYLYKRKHTVAEATVVVSVNNLLGMAAHLLLLGLVLLFEPNLLHRFTDGRHVISAQYAFAGAAIAVLVLLWRPVRTRIKNFVHHLLASLRRLSLQKLVPALLLAGLLTTTYTLILFTAAKSLNISLSLLQIFIVFSLGMLTQTATPTPGGLVGAEAGLFAGFVAYGVSDPAAAAAVLLYRLVSYWSPLAPGAVALAVARRRRLV